VAILNGGRVARSGSLDELRAQETSAIEVLAIGADAQALQQMLTNGGQVTSTPSGIRIEVGDERDVDEVLAALRKLDGKLIAVQPVRQSLEDLFVDSPTSS
jgi:ABC-type multidrug transport system ATPase subunit